MFLRQITDSALAQNAYLIGCQRSGKAIIVDPERDIDRYLELPVARLRQGFAAMVILTGLIVLWQTYAHRP